MSAKDMKVIHHEDTAGKLVSSVYDSDHAWQKHPCKTLVPGSSLLMNYDLKFGKKTLLVLDDYGNDYLSEAIGRRLVGTERNSHDFLIGINRATGEIHIVVFYREKGKLVAVIGTETFESKPKVPKKYLKLLDNLKSCKRPWMLTWKHEDWVNFHERETSWPEFMSAVVVSLELFPAPKKYRGPGGRRHLEVWGETHRIVTDWKG